VVVIIGSCDYPLALRNTAGPAGGYTIADSGYVSETNAVERESMRQADLARPLFADLSLGFFSDYLPRDQQLDLSALEANVNALIDVGSTDAQSPS
jgi:hypothetical protein